jgi:hypothetical protein
MTWSSRSAGIPTVVAMTNPSGTNRFSGPVFAGAVALAVGGVLDLVMAAGAVVGPADDSPPAPVVIALAVAGVVSAAGLLRSRGGLVAAYVARVVSAVLGVTAYVFAAPLWVLVLVTIGLVLSVAGIGLTAPSLRRSMAAPS